MTCKIDGCDKPDKARGWCAAHYHRYRRHGDPLGGREPRRKRRMTLPEFCEWALTERTAPRGGCLEWTAYKTRLGYGQAADPTRRRPVTVVHRLICEWAHGPAPAGKPCALHGCHNPACINPKHLHWGSKADNSREMREAGRVRSHDSRLTADQVHEIRRLAAGGASKPRLAERYGVSRQTVHAVVNRKTWAHVS